MGISILGQPVKICQLQVYMTQFIIIRIYILIIMRKVYGRGLNFVGQIDKTQKDYNKFTPIKQLEGYNLKDMGCGYLQSYFLLSDGQLVKCGHLMDTLTSIRMIRLYKFSPFLFRSLQGFKDLGKLIGLPYSSHQLTCLNKQYVLQNVNFTKAVFNQSAVHLFDDQKNMYVVGQNYYGQRGTSDCITSQFNVKKVKYLSYLASSERNLIIDEKLKNLSKKQESSQVKYQIIDAGLGFQHSILITETGQAFGCGRAQSCQIQPYKYHHYKDAVIVDMIVTPQIVYSKRKVVKAACGYKHSIILTQDGKLFALGSNKHGQCGLDFLKFQQIKKLTQIFFPYLQNQKIVDIKCGSNHTLILTNKHLYFMGNIQSNQNPFTIFRQNISSPTIIQLPSRPLKIFANLDRSAVITEDGKAYIFGGTDMSKKGGQSGKLQIIQDFKFDMNSLIGLGFFHTLICP